MVLERNPKSLGKNNKKKIICFSKKKLMKVDKNCHSFWKIYDIHECSVMVQRRRHSGNLKVLLTDLPTNYIGDC